MLPELFDVKSILVAIVVVLIMVLLVVYRDRDREAQLRREATKRATEHENETKRYKERIQELERLLGEANCELDELRAECKQREEAKKPQKQMSRKSLRARVESLSQSSKQLRVTNKRLKSDLSDKTSELSSANEENMALKQQLDTGFKAVVQWQSSESHNCEWRAKYYSLLEDDRKKSSELQEKSNELLDQYKGHIAQLLEQREVMKDRDEMMQNQLVNLYGDITVHANRINPYTFFPFAVNGHIDRNMKLFGRFTSRPTAGERAKIQRAYFGDEQGYLCMVSGDRHNSAGCEVHNLYHHVVGAHLTPVRTGDKAQMEGSKPNMERFDMRNPRNFLLLRKDIELAYDEFLITFEIDNDTGSMKMIVLHPDVDELVREKLRTGIRATYWSLEEKEKCFDEAGLDQAIEDIVKLVNVKMFNNAPVNYGNKERPYFRVLRSHTIVAVDVMYNQGWREQDVPMTRQEMKKFDERTEYLLELREHLHSLPCWTPPPEKSTSSSAMSRFSRSTHSQPRRELGRRST